jgi:hypothetical protein
MATEMVQGSSNKTANLLKSSATEGKLLGWLRLARFAWNGKEPQSSLPTAYHSRLSGQFCRIPWAWAADT